MMYSIYQLKDSARNKLFLSYDQTQKHGGVNFADYKTVYTGEIAGSDPAEILEKLYEIFNLLRPEDFHGHSLSVSDLVVLEDTGTYFCDSFGWKQIN